MVPSGAYALASACNPLERSADTCNRWTAARGLPPRLEHQVRLHPWQQRAVRVLLRHRRDARLATRYIDLLSQCHLAIEAGASSRGYDKLAVEVPVERLASRDAARIPGFAEWLSEAVHLEVQLDRGICRLSAVTA